MPTTQTCTRTLLGITAALFWLGGHLDGRSLLTPTVTPTSVAALIAVTLLFAVVPLRALPLRHTALLTGLLLGLALLKTLSLTAYQPPGLLARYYANPDFSPPHETSWRYRKLREQATRIDPALDFSGKGFSLREHTFPLHFINDWHRFSQIDMEAFERNEHMRRHFRFSAIWTGTLDIPAGIRALQWQVISGDGTLRVGNQVLQARDGQAERIALHHSGTLPLAAEYRRTADTPPGLQLAWSHDGTHFHAVPARFFSPQPEATRANGQWATLYRITLAGWLATLLAIAILAVRWRAWQSWHRERLALLGLFGLFGGLALLRQIGKGAAPDAEVFSTFNDWMRYETQAWAVLNGDWLNAGYTRGKAFFMNVLYRYWLAGLHWLAGESTLMVTWLQQLLMLGFLGFFYTSARRLFGWGAAAIALLWLLANGDIFRFPGMLLDTTFSILLSHAALYGLLRWRQQAGWPLLLACAALLALAIGTRANFLPFAAVAALWVAWPRTNTARWQPAAALLLLAAALLPVLLTGWRNAVVTGDWVWMPASGSYNLWIGNHPPVGERFDPFDFPPIPPSHEQARIAIDYILAEPLAFLYRIGYKLMYLFGIVLYESRIEWRVLLPTCLALAGFAAALLPRTPFREQRLLLGLWVMVNFASLCLVFPWVYGWRLSGPTLPAIALLAALAVQDGRRWLRNHRQAAS